MLSKIKRLGAETVIYGVMTVAGRFLTFLLVPFYTNVLTPGEYGIVAYTFSLIAFLTIFFSYGMESAYFKYASTEEIGTRQENFSTPFFSLLLSSVALSLVLTLFSRGISDFVGFGDSGYRLVILAAWILCFDTIALVPFAAMRLQHKAALFATIKLIHIVLNVFLNVFFLAFLGMGVEGVFSAGLIASALTLLILVPFSRDLIAFSFSVELWKQLLKFGLPYVPAGIAGIALQVVDRPILKLLTDDATVGIYQANYRLGIVIMLLVATFDYAYRPFFLNNASLPDAKQLFARVATYFYTLMTFVCIAVTIFLQDIVSLRIGERYLIHPDYWDGLAIVPIIMLAYVFTGWVHLLMPGIFIEKKTQYLPLVTGVAASVNVASNFLLIPMFGIMGAAYATLISYVVYACGMYWVSQRFYPIEYERKRLLIVSVCFLFFGLLTYFLFFIAGKEVNVAVQLLLVVSFPILILLSGFLNTDEADAVKQLWNRVRRWHG